MNILTGTWVLYIPYIKNKFQLNDSQIGIALFCTAIGLLISFPFVSSINKKIGVGRCTQIGIVLYSLAFNLPFITPNYYGLCAAMITQGICAGFTSISMNALVANIEKEKEVHFMSAAHGFYSLGGFIGASLGSLLLSLFSTPLLHMATVATVLILSNLLLSNHYNKITEAQTQDTQHQKSWKDYQALLGLAIIAFIVLMNEGAVEHWSNLYLFDLFKTPENQAGFGFMAFSLCMTIGRFFGDKVSENLGPIKIMLIACGIAVLGYGLALTPYFILSISGFGIVGFGLSVIIPEIFRLAGNTKGVQASTGISIVSGIGFSGFLAGPILMGFISDYSNLFYSFATLLVLVVVAFVLIQLVIKRTHGA